MSDLNSGIDAQQFLSNFLKSSQQGTAYDYEEDETKPRTYT